MSRCNPLCAALSMSTSLVLTSILEGQVVHNVRQRMGRELAREAPVDADVVVPVPDSATPAAIGYSLESGVPFTEGLIKNRYIGRTFIQPDDHLRQMGVQLEVQPALFQS